MLKTHPHLFSTAAVFVSHSQIAQMQALIAAVECVRASPEYRKKVLAKAPPLAQFDPGNPGVFFGYDFHLCDSPKLIEINTNAGGAMLNVALRRAQRDCCVEMGSYFDTQSAPEVVESAIVEMFVREWRAVHGNQELRSIAIVDDHPAEQYLYPEFLLLQELLEKHGISGIVVDVHDLQYRDGGLFAGTRRIDLVYNRLTDFYFEETSSSALANAYSDRAVVVTPHPHAHALYANKRNLTILANEGELTAMGIPQHTIEILLRGIPETRSVAAVDAEDWWRERKSWFFKPVRGFGSRGSYRGDKLTRKAFADVLSGEYVAQRIARPSERRVAKKDGAHALKLDVRNYVYAGETQLLGVRLYDGQTTNLRTDGGGFAPIYIAPGVRRFKATCFTDYERGSWGEHS